MKLVKSYGWLIALFLPLSLVATATQQNLSLIEIQTPKNIRNILTPSMIYEVQLNQESGSQVDTGELGAAKQNNATPKLAVQDNSNIEQNHAESATVSADLAQAASENNSEVKGQEAAAQQSVLLMRSLMFDDEQIHALRNNLLLLLEQEQQENDFNDKNFVAYKGLAAMLVSPRVSPIFFVNSLIYLADDDWTIWLNNEKINAVDNLEQKYDNFTVIEIDNKNVTFKWQTPYLDRLSPNWQQKLIATENNHVFNSQDGKISYNRHLQFLRFTLGSNQTLRIDKMQIIEGKRNSRYF